MKKYSWIISDLDGTIIDHTKKDYIIYDEVVDAINTYIAAGHKFTIATGRHYKDVISIIHSYKINFQNNFYIVGMNGGQIYSWGEKKLIYEAIIPNDKIPEIKIMLTKLQEKYGDRIVLLAYGENQNFYLMKSDGPNFDKMHQKIMKYENNNSVFNYLIINKDQFFSLINISKYCIAFDEELKNPKDLVAELNKMTNSVTFLQSGVNFVEIMPNKVNKWSAISLINDNYYHINNEDILTLGDSGNDIEMLSASGCSITRSCAPDYIRKIVDVVLDDGPSMFVKTAIEKYGKGK
ncbi:MAG: HAD-IIB family hydrolase [Mycoplasmoidaceae bacterium]